MKWGFYGRTRELQELVEILGRRRWFFVRVTGRRRIGKTTLVQQALKRSGVERVCYVQIPDSAPSGVVSTVRDAMDTFDVPTDRFPRPDSLLSLAGTVENLIRSGYIVALDEFQYFARKQLSEFTSHLQASVDRLAADTGEGLGGLVVLGSLHAELVALLEDRDAPLYNRTTDHIKLPHLDIASVLSILKVHAEPSPERLLFLWNLFEGVPKFYRDAFEQGAIALERQELLRKMFFGSSSPLRVEAEHWFLSELRGRYDVVLKYVARKPGSVHAAILADVRELSPGTQEQVGGYLQILVDKYELLECRQPIFAKQGSRQGRYYVRDNFLRCWLAALQPAVSAINFRPERPLIEQADVRLKETEGHGLERLVAQLYAERSRNDVGDFSLSRRIEGFWDRKDTEIDVVALDDRQRIIRFVSCKRDAARLVGDVAVLRGHADRFLLQFSKYVDWKSELVAVAPRLTKEIRAAIEAKGALPQDLGDLMQGLPV